MIDPRVVVDCGFYFVGSSQDDDMVWIKRSYETIAHFLQPIVLAHTQQEQQQQQLEPLKLSGDTPHLLIIIHSG